MKKVIITAILLAAMSPRAGAIDYVDWVDWDFIEHWAGDPEGENKCALVVDFQDGQSDQSLVWGFRWNGSATGEDLVRAVAGQSSILTAMIQYTGTMGSTLNGLGVSMGREHLDHLVYDFDRAAIGGEVSFGYFEPNTTMGQQTAPGYEAADMCNAAIERARTTGIIEHPLNAFMYGYPAYDYDYWQMEEGYRDTYDMRWRAGWYDGYWSYWHGPNDYDYMSYSGLGMSSVVLSDGCVQAWKYIVFNSGGSYGDTGEDLHMDLNYDMSDWGEEMHSPQASVQPVDQSKVEFWVGEGEKSATVVFQFKDGKGPENLVYGYRWTGGWDDNLSKVVGEIAAADPRMNLSAEGSDIAITYDSNHDGVIDTKDHAGLTGRWSYFVKRTVDSGFSKVSGDRWLNPNAVLVVSCQADGVSSVELPYLLYRPALDSENIITMPGNIDYALADKMLELPVFVQVPEGGKMNTAFNVVKDTELTAVINLATVTNQMCVVKTYKNFKPTEGTIKVRGSYTAPGETKATYIFSNDVFIRLEAPEKPITAMRYAEASVEAPLFREVANQLIYEPADATYTKITYKSSNTRAASVSNGVVKTTKTPGSATITATYDYDAGISAAFDIESALRNPVADINFECADENAVITLNPKEMAGLFPIVSPSDADVPDVTVTLSGNGTDMDSYIATTYTVKLWDADNKISNIPELSAHRVGECKLTAKASDGSGFEKEFTIKVVEPDRGQAIDYTTGTIMLNEEWYGHTNGGLNWYSPEYEVVYQAYERENPGKSFGCTSQYGIIYGGKLIVSSKQASDGGDPLPGGGRLVVADAATLKYLGSIDDIKLADESRSGDGRALCGAGPGRVYMGTHNGIYIVDIENFEILGKVGGEFLDGEDDGKPNTDPDGSLYSGQIGDMVLAGHHVFALRQSGGVYIIDIDTDKIVSIIEDINVQGITQSADGCVWYATTGAGKTEFVALDINTLREVNRVEVPKECGTVNCGWGAWRTTQFTGAQTLNSLFFAGGSSITNGGSGIYWRYDIDEDKFTHLVTVAGLPGHTPGMTQGAYGTVRFDDRSGELIAGTTEFKASGHYRYNWTHFIDGRTGEILRTVELRPYYWFQAHPIFPDVYAPEMEEVDLVHMGIDDGPVEIILNVTDRDNHDANIRISLADAPAMLADDSESEPEASVEVALEGNRLILSPKAVGEHTIGISLESNGRVTTHAVAVRVNDKQTSADALEVAGGSIFSEDQTIVVRGYEGVRFAVINPVGAVVDTFTATSADYIRPVSLHAGVYVITDGAEISKKLIVK